VRREQGRVRRVRLGEEGRRVKRCRVQLQGGRGERRGVHTALGCRLLGVTWAATARAGTHAHNAKRSASRPSPSGEYIVLKSDLVVHVK